MLFIAFFSGKPGQAPEKGLEAYVRRARWQYPSSVKVTGDYWLIGSQGPEMVAILETSDAAALMSLTDSWSDVFDVRIAPAITAEEGIKLMAQTMQAHSV